MEKCYHESFKNDLSGIINDFSGGVIGVGVARAIAEELETICDFIESNLGKSNLVELILSKYSHTKVYPRVYRDNGCEACDSLFFEHKFEKAGVYAVVGFYLPSLFLTQSQKEELCLFTRDGSSKSESPTSIEFYFATADAPTII